MTGECAALGVGRRRVRAAAHALELRRALGRCTRAERERLGRRVVTDRSRGALAAVIALAERSIVPDENVFAGAAPVAYALRGAFDGERAGPFRPLATLRTLCGVAAGAPGRRALRGAVRLDDVREFRASYATRARPELVRRPIARAVRVRYDAAHLAPAAPVLACSAIARVLHGARAARRST